MVLVLAIVGCSGQTLPPTNVTSNSATLNGSVQCDHAGGTISWELRRAGQPAWDSVGAASPYTCNEKRTLLLSRNVTGLQAGDGYVYRLAADPAPAGGPVFRSNATSFASRRFSPGLVSSANHPLSAAAAGALGADIVRIEFDIGASPAAMRASVGALADQGARPLLLAGFHGRMPTVAEVQNLGAWAAEFGPGGTFWAARTDDHLAVQQIEFGNETSYAYQYGDTYAAQSYKDRARLYATRFAQAKAAIGFSGRDVGLLAQGDDGGSGSSNWVDGMFDAVPDLAQLVDGWTVHPYGPRTGWKPKVDRLMAQTAANGAPATIPIDITEYGISSDNGKSLTHNYGWAVNQTYGQAAAALDSTIAEMRADAAFGPRLRMFMIYAAHDHRAPGTSSDREAYFGALQSNLAEKGAYSTEVREQLAR